MLRDELISRRLLLHFYSVGRRRRRLQVGYLPGVLFQPTVTAVVFARSFWRERERERERERDNGQIIIDASHDTVLFSVTAVGVSPKGGPGPAPPSKSATAPGAEMD